MVRCEPMKIWLTICIIGFLVIFHFQCSSVTGLDFEYHDHEDLEQYLKNISANYTDLTYLYSIGKSVEGRELWVLEVTAANLSRHEISPNVKIIGNIHGNEPVGKEMILHLIEHLVTNYGLDSEITKLLNTTRIHFLPNMNPDGGEIALEEQCIGTTGRENNHNIDLNRNFPDLHNATVTKENRVEQPETRAVREWMMSKLFILSASLHGGALVANYPFENNTEGDHRKESKSPDDDVCKHLAKTYAEIHTEMHKGVQCEGGERFPGGIVNGAAWYPVQGGMQDYNYLAFGVIEITLELSCCKYPQSSELKKHWDENRAALIHYIDEVHQGVNGRILDKLTRRPVKDAVLKITGREVKFYNDDDGYFWRILLPGRYTLEVIAPGYVKYAKKFEVARGPATPTTTSLEVLLTRNYSRYGNDIGDDQEVFAESRTPSHPIYELDEHKDVHLDLPNGQLDNNNVEYRVGEVNSGKNNLIMNGILILMAIFMSFKM